jgi:IS1 family transposase
VAWVLGSRSAATFKRLYAKVKHLKDCVFYSDKWDAFAKVLPESRHHIGKQHTAAIERDNGNTRHHLGRMTRRTKVVSKKKEMVNKSLKLWLALTDLSIFIQYQERFLSIFR